jgi:hypothetical protein
MGTGAGFGAFGRRAAALNRVVRIDSAADRRNVNRAAGLPEPEEWTCLTLCAAFDP